jgi:integrase
VIAQTYRDRHDPDKLARLEAEAKLKTLQAEKESQTVSIEKAVSAFLVWKENNPSRQNSKLSGKASDSTMTGWRTLLGNVDSEGVVLRKGHLFTWLDQRKPRPILISDLTPVLVDGFRASWRMNDLTTAKNFTRLNAFFDYCKNRGEWIEKNPLEGLNQPSVKDGNRTAAFSGPQYQAILDTLAQRPQTDNNHRLLALAELMRWGGLAIHDAVNFHQDILKDDGRYYYRRQKTNVEAKPTLIPDAVSLLRTVVPINGDKNQPFRNVSRDIKSDKDYWRLQLGQLFADAGITKVKTGIGVEKTPHSHMFRDTYAVGQLQTQYNKLKQVNLLTIADALGDNIATFTKHYKPWIDELEEAHKAAQSAIVEAQQAERAQRQASGKKVVNIGRGK